MSVFEKGLITICVYCALFVVVSLPLIFRKVPRNSVYGYRTRATLSDDALWYEANAYFGRWFFVMSVLTAGAAVALDLWRSVSPGAYLKISVVLLVTPVVVAGLLTGRFVRSWLAGWPIGR
ncbi:MAG: SdpI family protein [Deltaproteobacteria bacterium]|nr:SdpI family protein [Deltaproteobacteria bacterium]